MHWEIKGKIMSAQIRVAILDDHQAIMDGYLYRLAGAVDIQVVATMLFGDELEPTLEKTTVDVLILDIQVPTNQTNPNPYPLLYLLPKLIEEYPAMNMVVISMHNQRTLVRNILEAGASGYILKDDRTAMLDLPAVIRVVANGGVVYSPQVAAMLKAQLKGEPSILTPRQLEVLSYCAAYPEISTAEIALKFNVSHSTVRNLLSGAYLRLDVPNRTAAISKARQMGLITPV